MEVTGLKEVNGLKEVFVSFKLLMLFSVLMLFMPTTLYCIILLVSNPSFIEKLNHPLKHYYFKV